MKRLKDICINNILISILSVSFRYRFKPKVIGCERAFFLAALEYNLKEGSPTTAGCSETSLTTDVSRSHTPSASWGVIQVSRRARVGFYAFREWLWSTRLSSVSACNGRRTPMQPGGCSPSRWSPLEKMFHDFYGRV